MNQSLAHLLERGRITLDACFSESSKTDELEGIIASMGITRDERQEPKSSWGNATI
jgi:hypothetical protein